MGPAANSDYVTVNHLVAALGGLRYQGYCTLRVGEPLVRFVHEIVLPRDRNLQGNWWFWLNSLAHILKDARDGDYEVAVSARLNAALSAGFKNSASYIAIAKVVQPLRAIYGLGKFVNAQGAPMSKSMEQYRNTLIARGAPVPFALSKMQTRADFDAKLAANQSLLDTGAAGGKVEKRDGFKVDDSSIGDYALGDAAVTQIYIPGLNPHEDPLLAGKSLQLVNMESSAHITEELRKGRFVTNVMRDLMR
jgi:hypothetical protein